LRGVPVRKTEWFYGPAFTSKEIRTVLSSLAMDIVREEGVGEKYYWVTAVKP
jgi:hypothetical protein